MTAAGIFEAGAIPALDVETLLQAVGAHGYCAIRGLFGAEEMRRALSSIHAGFDAGRDHPGMSGPGMNGPGMSGPGTGGGPSDVMGNYQKLVIGAGAQANYPVPRFVRVLYNPIWAEDIYGMRGIFTRLARLRNHIQGHAPDYAVDRVEDGLWTAARLQHYPTGGGFFAPHRDAVSPTASGEAGLLRFIQILLLITARGADYSRGGAFLDTDAGRQDLEAECTAGDVLVYDGRSLHGVADIDPHRLADLKSPQGRMVAMVTLYADMSGDAARYRHYRTREFPG